MGFGGSGGGGSSSISGSTDVAFSNVSNGQTLIYDGSVAKWKNTNPSSANNPGLINVKDYGAIGDGSIDDTNAIIAARNAVWATASSNGNICAKKLYFPGGRYKVSQPGALLNSPNVSGGAQTIIYGYQIVGDGKRSSQVIYTNTAAAAGGTHPASNALFVAGNRVNQLRITGMSFSSSNAVNTCFFFWSRTNADTNYAYPEYGWGHNQDIIFTDVEIAGAWRWGVLLDGDQCANLNSEFFLYNCAVTPTSTFAGAVFQSGYTNYTSNDQQDQFLNYSFVDCKFEYKYGDCLVFNRGGAISVRGGSFILGVSDDTNKVGGTFFKNNAVPFHNLSATQVIFSGVRYELRNENCSMIDSAWSGSNAHITLDSCSDTGLSWASFGPSVASVTLRANGGSHANVYARNCALGGHWEILGNQTSATTRIVLDMCNIYNNGSTYQTGGIGTKTANNTFLQYDGTNTPKYRYRDCSGITDASN